MVAKQRSSRLHSGVILLLYFLLSVLMTYPLVLHLGSAVPSDIGDPLLNTYILAWDTHALITDPLSLFNANIYHPLSDTLAYSEHLLSIALLALPIELFSGEPLVAYNLSLLLSFPLAAYGMYLLLFRRIRRRDVAFVAGLAFGFAPYGFAAIAHLQLLNFQWLPFAILSLERLILNERSKFASLALLLFLWLQLLASWYLAVFSGLILALYLAGMILRGHIPPRRLVPVMGTLAGVGLLTLPLALPYFSLFDSLHEARSLSTALTLAAAPTDYAAAAPFNRLFGPLTAFWRVRPGFTEEHLLFSGLIAPALALVALASWLTSRRQRSRLHLLMTMTGVLVVSVLLTFPGPYSGLSALFPPLTVIRAPARWVIPGLFALAWLAGLGSAVLLERLTDTRRVTLVGLICLLLVVEGWSVPIPLAEVSNHQALNPVYSYLARQPADFALLELPLHSAPAPEYPEGKRLYASTLGWWPLVNGYSGYTPPRQMELGRALSGFPDQQSVTALQALALSLPDRRLLLLVHPDEAPFDRRTWEDGAQWQAEKNPTLVPLGRFWGDELYEVQSSPLSLNRLAVFGDPPVVELVGAQLVEFAQQPSAEMVQTDRALVLLWRVNASPEKDWSVFVHLRAADGFIRSQADGQPVSSHYPSSRWVAGEVIQDVHLLREEEWPQVDHLFIGLYDLVTGERVPAFDPDGVRLPDDGFRIED